VWVGEAFGELQGGEKVSCGKGKRVEPNPNKCVGGTLNPQGQTRKGRAPIHQPTIKKKKER